MKRTLDQSALFHVFCAEIAEFLNAGSVRCSPGMVKELVKMTLGNTTEFLGTKISMPTSSYQRSDADLTEGQLKAGVVSMESLLEKMVAWSSTDLNLELKSTNEVAV